MTNTPLDLFVEVTTANSKRFKWDANQAADSRPRNLSFRTKIGEGFSDASLQLARRIDLDYPDLNLVNNVVITGADGYIAYEGRVAANPRDLAESHSIGVTIAGWMAHAKDRKFTEIYVDRSAAGWHEAPLARRAAMAVAGQTQGKIQVAVADGGFVWEIPNEALPSTERTELHYDPGPGLVSSAFAYQGARTGAFTTLEAATVYASATEDFAASTNAALTLDDTLRSTSGYTAARYLMLRVATTGSVTPAAGHQQRYSRFAVYGAHGLPTPAGETGEPDGVYASDVMRDIAARWCPMLDTSGVEDTTYVIQHLSFRDRTYPFDAFLELNKYHLWHLGVWDNRQLVFRPYDLTDYDWEIRTDDQGTTFSPQGPSTDSLFNGIVVTYTDLLWSTTKMLTPDDDSTLADTSPENPWNLAGIDHWDEITLSAPTTAESAVLLGRAALADRNRPKTPGTITVAGYIRDRGGQEQPAWKVRAGDTISITNFPNDSPRLIVETDYDDETKTIRLSIDKPFALLDAYLDRQANALQAAGLA